MECFEGFLGTSTVVPDCKAWSLGNPSPFVVVLLFISLRKQGFGFLSLLGTSECLNFKLSQSDARSPLN